MHIVTRTIKEAILSKSMTQPLTGTMRSTRCPTSGMRSYRTPQPSTSHKPSPPHNGLTPMAHMRHAYSHSSYWQVWSFPLGVPVPPFLATVSVRHKIDDIIYILFPSGCRDGALWSQCHFFKIFHINICYNWGEWWTYSCSLELLVKLVLEGEYTVIQNKFQKRYL